MGGKPRIPAPVDLNAHTELSRRWREAGRDYCAAINAFVAIGETKGWDGAGEEPRDGRSAQDAAAVLDLVRGAQAPETFARLRQMFPPGFAVMADQLSRIDTWVGPVVFLDTDVLLVTVGEPWRKTITWQVGATSCTRRDDIVIAGRSPKGEIVALGRAHGVDLHRGWNGALVATLPWPREAALPKDVAPERPPRVDEIIAFDDGAAAVLVSSAGVFLLQADGATLLYPDATLLAELVDVHREHSAAEPFAIDLRMQHAAVSPDGSLIAVGAQDGKHLVLDRALGVVARIGPHGEYPHHTVFTADAGYLAANACHFYNGATVAVAVADLPGLDTEFYASDARVRVINSFARVYGSASRGDELFLGDAYGYVHGVRASTGEPTCKHFVGGNITGMDISPGGELLAVATTAGMVHLIELDAGDDPFRIGRSRHRERCRWLMWPEEKRPLRW